MNGGDVVGNSESASNIRHRNGWRRKQVVAEVLASEDTCFLCGKPVDKSLPPGQPGSPEIDEDIPVSRGGSFIDRRNCHLAHRLCNGIKHNHSTAWARHKLGHPSAVGGAVHAVTADALRRTKPFG